MQTSMQSYYEQPLPFCVQEYPAPADGGYLIIADDTLINHCQVQHFNVSKVCCLARPSLLSFARPSNTLHMQRVTL